MTPRQTIIGGLVAAALAAAACTTSNAEPATGSNAATQPAAAPQPATPPAAASGHQASPAAPAAAPPGEPAKSAEPAPSAEPAKSAQSAAESAKSAAADTPDVIRRRAQIEWALRQDEVKHDPHGQWAVSAKASSGFNDAQGTTARSPNQATGAPDVEVYGSTITAWQPKTASSGIEWLELGFAKPVHATAVRVRESCGSGAVIRIELFDEQGAPHTVWSGVDSTKELDYLIAEFPRTPFTTARVRVTLATNLVSGIKQIDAVQLVGSEQ
jgi:hypothetical protein